jgi:hypothetical protein
MQCLFEKIFTGILKETQNKNARSLRFLGFWRQKTAIGAGNFPADIDIRAKI